MTKAELIESLSELSDGADVYGSLDLDGIGEELFNIIEVVGPIPDPNDQQFGVLTMIPIKGES